MKTRIYTFIILPIVTVLSSSAVSASVLQKLDEVGFRHEQSVPTTTFASQQIGTLTPDTLRADSLQVDTLRNFQTDTLFTDNSAKDRFTTIDTPIADSLLMVDRDSLPDQLIDTPDIVQTIPEDSTDMPIGQRRFLPTRRRIDRGINRISYIFKQEVAIGLTVSYGSITSDDTDYLLILDDLNFSGSVFTINPSVSYFVKDNLSIGLRYGYSKTDGHVDNATLDLGEINDVNTSFSNITLKDSYSSIGFFVRSYAGIDAKRHFGVFAELEASYRTGKSIFSYDTNGEFRYSHGHNQRFKLSFNPGCSVFLFPRACCSISFGLGGVQYTKVTQTDTEGKVVGSREAAKMRFRLNIADIRFGLNILL